jgi:hypothetical protein
MARTTPRYRNKPVMGKGLTSPRRVDRRPYNPGIVRHLETLTSEVVESLDSQRQDLIKMRLFNGKLLARAAVKVTKNSPRPLRREENRDRGALNLQPTFHAETSRSHRAMIFSVPSTLLTYSAELFEIAALKLLSESSARMYAYNTSA